MEVAVAAAPSDAPALQANVTSGSDFSAPVITTIATTVVTEVEGDVGLGQEEQQEVSMEGSESSGSKRGRDHEPGDHEGFIKPNNLGLMIQSLSLSPHRTIFLTLPLGYIAPVTRFPPVKWINNYML